MVKILIGVVVAAVAFTVYAVIDCAWMPRSRVRALNRPAWLVIIIVLPILGGVLWYILGRAPASRPRTSRYLGPDDDPDFLGTAGGPGMTSSEKERNDATLRNLEQQLADLDDDSGTGRERPER